MAWFIGFLFGQVYKSYGGSTDSQPDNLTAQGVRGHPKSPFQLPDSVGIKRNRRKINSEIERESSRVN